MAVGESMAREVLAIGSLQSGHLAHLSQVDCQFGSRPKPFQNNNLQFDADLFSSHLAHFAHTQRGRELWKNLRTGLTKTPWTML